MVSFKIVISDPKTGKSAQREVKDNDAKPFVGKKIGDEIKGEVINLTGFEFKLTGGSDSSGFPMRPDLEGSQRKKILAVGGIGIKPLGKGIRQRKTVAGNTVHDKTAQINLVVTKQGKEDIFKAAEKPAEEKSEEKPAEEKKPAKPEKKVEEKSEEKPEKPKEDKA
ncbi:MAG: 30S ribosomal protein S6e [Nanoarchaeota archaeon]|nr:30S ribosomal protein S6e [Nanoarchaeota archaeon]